MTNMHKKLCDTLHDIYVRKNHDYGSSYGKIRQEYPIAILIRLSDKLERLKTLIGGEDNMVAESIEDTLLDMANYCLTELVERKKNEAIRR